MKKSSFVEGTIIATVAIILVKVLGMAYIIPFYAIIGEMGRALYGFAYNIYVIFLDISSAGIPIAISKIVSEFSTLNQLDAKKRTLKIGRKLVGIVSFLAFILLFAFANLIAKTISVPGGNTIEDIAFVIRVISFALLIIPYLSVSKGYLQGHKFITPSSISQLLEQIVRIIFVLAGSYLALKVFNLSLRTGIGIAVFGAFVGGLCALIYIVKKIKDNKKALNLDEDLPKDNITNKEIAKKIISYAVPFIIIDTAVSIYHYIDMVLILKTLNFLEFSAINTEYIATSITTWAPKISTIVGALAMGMSVSLIPSIVSAYSKKDWTDVNRKLNRALQIILVISIPITIGISLLAKPMWTLFFEYNPTGTIILAANIFTVLFLNLFMITTSTLQSLNKFKTVYIACISGFVANAILDVPFMLLFHKVGIAPYLGAILATVVGYTISIIIALRALKKENDIEYKSTANILFKLIIPTIVMTIIIVLGNIFIPYNDHSKISSLIHIVIIALIGGISYLLLTFKNGTLNKAFGTSFVNKIIKKLTFDKVSIKD